MKQVRILILMLLSVILSCCGPKLEPTPTPPTPTPPTPTPPEPVEKNYVAIKDANFKSYILTNFDTDKDGGIDESEAQAIKKIECKNLGISSLDGIRCFTNLETLDCSGNNLESLVLCNTGETKASVPEGNCSKLKAIECSGNKIASVEISACAALETFVASNNQLVQVDLSGNPALESVNVSGNTLTDIDLSANPALSDVDLSGNELTDIDLSSNPALESVNLSGNSLTSIDLSENPALVSLDVSDNSLASIDLSENTNLQNLSVGNNELTELDLSGNPEISNVDCSGNSDLKEVAVPESSAVEVHSDEGVEKKESEVIAVTGVILDNTSLALPEGGSQTLVATVTPENATRKKVAWSSGDETVATVDKSGKVTAVKAGTATITVTTADGNKTATCAVTVVSEFYPVTGVFLDKTTLTMAEGDSLALVATIAPENATNKDVTWSSDDGTVATVDKSGKVTAVKAGTATITVTTADGNKTATCAVTVNPKVYPVTGVSLDKTTLTMAEGDSLALVATIAPENATNKDVTWSSSDETVATVDQGGKVTAVTAGTATITVTTADGNKTATCAVTVNPKVYPVTGVSLDKTTLTMAEGDSLALVATIAPENATNKDVTWSSSDGTVATVDQSGNVTAVKAGTATITVTSVDGNKTATCAVTVNPKVYPVTGVSLDKTTLTMAEGDSLALVATIAPENATNKDVTWSSSDETVATVDQGGKVTAVTAGTATITVTTADGNKTATCAVTVNPKVYPVTVVSLDKTTLTMTEGDSQALVATIAPENATNKDVTWSSSDETVATVDQGGKVTAVTAGTATITVTTADGNKTATCAVTVNPKVYPVTGVSLDKTTLTLYEGESKTLIATIAPENATNKDVTWSSSDGTVATVDQSGNVTAVKAGTATITVTTADGNKTATCAVTVEEAASGQLEDPENLGKWEW